MPSLPACCLAIKSIVFTSNVVTFSSFRQPRRSHFWSFLTPWEINFWVFFDAWALIFESGGPFGWFLEPLSDFLEKSEFTDPTQRSRFWNFFDIFFNRFFGVLSFLDFYAFACPKGPFWLSFRLLFESPGLFKKQLKVCNYRRFSRFGPFRMRLF